MRQVGPKHLLLVLKIEEDSPIGVEQLLGFLNSELEGVSLIDPIDLDDDVRQALFFGKLPDESN